MNRTRKTILIVVFCLCVVQTGCGKNADDLEKDDGLDGWIGQYSFSEIYNEEGYAFMFMNYNIDIYEEAGQYYANLKMDGQMTGVDVKAHVYGDEEWVSLVLIEYTPEHVTGVIGSENSVILSLRKQGEEVYTYWGEVTPLLEDNELSGEIYFKKTLQME